MSSSWEHKTFKASRWGHSRASTRRGAGRARCGLHEHGRQQEQAPPDMLTGQSIRACLRREVPTDHEPHSETQRRQLRRVAPTELRRECTPEAEAEQATHGRIRTPKRNSRNTIAVMLKPFAGAFKLWKHGPPRTEPGGGGEWCWSVQQTTHRTRRCVVRSSA